MKTNKNNTKKKYISIKLPADYSKYPYDRNGCNKLPNYTTEYLKKHGRKLFYILYNKVPSPVYVELVKCIKEVEK